MPRIGWDSNKGAQIVALLREGKTPDEIAAAINTGTGAVKGFYKRDRQRMDSTSTKARAKRPRSSPAVQHGDDIARVVENLVRARVNEALERAVSALRDALEHGKTALMRSQQAAAASLSNNQEMKSLET
ncbi:MAG TPA: hypothetical protein VKX17_13415 [Planctomycetota bacterium]|nr:hypothetical protein [Planctomycetota bacterium]